MPSLLSEADIRQMMKVDVDRIRKNVEKWYDEKPSLLGLPTALERVDKLLGGLSLDELLIVAGDPGGGKTSLMMQMVETTAAYIQREGMALVNLVFSAEMSRQQLYFRLACSLAHLDSTKVRRGQITGQQRDDFIKKLNYVYSLPLLVIDQRSHSGITSDDILNVVRILSEEESMQFGVIGIDYIQQLYDEGADTQRLNHIMRNLVQVKALSAGCVVALSQYTKKKGQEKRAPELDDLLGTGNIARAADQVWMLHDPEVPEKYTGGGPDAYLKEMYVKKNRNGPTGRISLWYIPTQTRFFSSPEVAPTATVRPLPTTAPTPLRGVVLP